MSAIATQDLTAANSTIVMKVPNDHRCVAAVHYPASGGSGTVVLEASINMVDYVVVGMTPASNGAVVQSLAAAGIGFADVSWAKSVRVRKSVGTSASLITLSLSCWD